MKRGQGINRTVERLEIWKGFEAQRSFLSQQVSLFEVVAFQSKYSSVRIILILEMSMQQMQFKEPKERLKTSYNFTLSNDYKLDNIITKQLIACQHSQVLITLSRVTV